MGSGLTLPLAVRSKISRPLLLTIVHPLQFHCEWPKCSRMTSLIRSMENPLLCMSRASSAMSSQMLHPEPCSSLKQNRLLSCPRAVIHPQKQGSSEEPPAYPVQPGTPRALSDL